MKRTREPWMSADDLGRSLPRGIGINLLVSEIAAMEAFCGEVLGATTIYVDEDFAAIQILGSIFMLHADHSYAGHEMFGSVADVDIRGSGVEIRIYGSDPDLAEAKARASGQVVLSASIDKPHGLRECHLISPDGYVFVPSRAIGLHEIPPGNR